MQIVPIGFSPAEINSLIYKIRIDDIIVYTEMNGLFIKISAIKGYKLGNENFCNM